MDDTRREELAERLARLRSDYLGRLPNELASLKSLAESLIGGQQDRDALEAMHYRLHKLAGTGGSFGLNELSSAARVLDQRVERWKDGDLEAVSAADRTQLVEDVDALEVAAAETDPGPPGPTLPQKEEAPGEKIRIWLVEDDAHVGRQLKHQLESFNYSVRLFESIEHAGRVARSEQPDLLILDVMFDSERESTSKRAASPRALKALECPLLFITAHDDFLSRVSAARLGAMGYFIQPIDVPRLVSRITHIFDQRRAPPQRVLIVDDDRDLAEHMRLVLEAQGMEATVLQAPKHIIEEIAAFRPELVLMDMHMPEFSGPDLAGVIRQYEKYANLPIVYLSAEKDVTQQISAMDCGADDFLTKPISDFQLVAAVRARIARARQLDEQISKDSLTGLLKHASIKEAVEVNVRLARRGNKATTLAMLDIDHFKAINDTYGHAKGDVVIAALATLLRQRLRQSDLIGRYGGEEFVVILPECDTENARQVMEDLRERFSSLRFNHHEQEFSCTVSVGLACTEDHQKKEGAELLVVADEALYTAKRGGRDRVNVAT